VLHLFSIGPALVLGLLFAAQAGMNLSGMRQMAESASGPHGSTGSPRPEPDEGREKSESAPAAAEDARRGATSSGDGAPRAARNVVGESR